MKHLVISIAKEGGTNYGIHGYTWDSESERPDKHYIARTVVPTTLGYKVKKTPAELKLEAIERERLAADEVQETPDGVTLEIPNTYVTPECVIEGVLTNKRNPLLDLKDTLDNIIRDTEVDGNVLVVTTIKSLVSNYKKLRRTNKTVIPYTTDEDLIEPWKQLEPWIMENANIEIVKADVLTIISEYAISNATLNYPKTTYKLVDPTYYYKCKLPKPPLLTFNHQYSTVSFAEGWSLGTTNDYIGRAIHDIGFGIVQPNPKDASVQYYRDVMVMIRNASNDGSNNIDVNMSAIFKPTIIARLTTHRGACMVIDEFGDVFVGDVVIAKILSIPLMLINGLEQADVGLIGYKMFKDNHKEVKKVIDITDVFFEGEKQTLKKQWGVGISTVKLNRDGVKLTFLLGTQILDRNSLNRLKGKKEITIVFFRYNGISRWIIVITSDDGTGIYFNPYTNIVSNQLLSA